jgi:hypothetical protein
MDGPVLAFGGPYGNLEATTALLAEALRPSSLFWPAVAAAA